jgi:hypothetical protein
MTTAVEKAKSMYVSQLKQLRHFYASNLEDLKKDLEIESALGSVFDDFSEVLLRSISQEGVEGEKLEKACSTIEVKKFKSNLKTSLIGYYAEKVNELDNLIQEL